MLALTRTFVQRLALCLAIAAPGSLPLSRTAAQEEPPPTEETEPQDSTEPEDSTEPTHPIESTDPTDSTDATESIDPTDPIEATDPTDATDAAESTDPTDSTDATESIDPTDSIESTDPTDTTEPIETTDPTDTIDPIESTDPTDTTDPMETTGPTDTTGPGESTDPTDTTDPNETTDPTDTTDPIETTDPLPPAAPCGADATGKNLLGLYVDSKCDDPTPDPRLHAYKPRYELWSDGADKERFFTMPDGAKIDTKNPDRWSFPNGTVLYKTFSRNNRKIETRKISKQNNSWTFETFAWSADERTTTPHRGGKVEGVDHWIPTQSECLQCHRSFMGGADPILGFGAIQLNHTDTETTLASILAMLENSEGEANVSTATAVIPGVKDSPEQLGLGYLHGNCSNCHGGTLDEVGYPDMKLWTRVGETELTATSPIMETAVCNCLTGWLNRTNEKGDKYLKRIDPRNADLSGVIGRIRAPGTAGGRSTERMPMIGTAIPHQQGIEWVSAWINSLPSDACSKVCE